MDHLYGGREGGGSCVRWEGGRGQSEVRYGKEEPDSTMYVTEGEETSRRYVMGRKSQIARCTSRRGKSQTVVHHWEGMGAGMGKSEVGYGERGRDGAVGGTLQGESEGGRSQSEVRYGDPFP